MKSVLMSINSLNNANIESGLKGSELRTRPPKIKPPFKVFTYESGSLGRHKVVNEWICRSMTTWRMCMGIPAHLSKKACVSNEYIWKYSNNGYKDITEMEISDLVIYDKPRELNRFQKPCIRDCDCGGCENAYWTRENGFEGCMLEEGLTRPPQSWCYVESGDT